MLSQEIAIVWRGGGRRWFSKMAACRAEARALINKRCECEDSDENTPGYLCHYHSLEYYGRIMDRLTRHIAHNFSRSH